MGVRHTGQCVAVHASIWSAAARMPSWQDVQCRGASMGYPDGFPAKLTGQGVRRRVSRRCLGLVGVVFRVPDAASEVLEPGPYP